MKRERIDIKPGDRIRCPDRATAAWHAVVRVGRRRDGTRYVTIRRGRIGRLLGLSPMQRLEWGHLKALGYGLKRTKAADHATVTSTAGQPRATTEVKADA